MGWTVVQRWCQEWGTSRAYLSEALDILIVQVDGDVRGLVKVPDNGTLCDRVKTWLGPSASLPGLVIVIPTEATETWLLAAHRSAAPTIERLKKPGDQLVKAGLLDHDEKGRPTKDANRYRELAAQLAARLVALPPVVRELDRFCSKVEAVVAARLIVDPSGPE